jgi:hypothetical protein
MIDVKRLQNNLNVLVGVYGVHMRIPQDMANASVILNLVKKKNSLAKANINGEKD